jgi:hypothetical protein
MGSFPKWVKWVLIINVVAISGTEKVFQKDFFCAGNCVGSFLL